MGLLEWALNWRGPVAAEGGDRERGHAPQAALFRGRHFKEDKKIRLVYAVHGHLNALHILISVHRMCSVTFTMQYALNSSSAGAPPHMHAGELATLPSRLGPRARRGGRTNVSPGRHRPSRRHWSHISVLSQNCAASLNAILGLGLHVSQGLKSKSKSVSMYQFRYASFGIYCETYYYYDRIVSYLRQRYN